MGYIETTQISLSFHVWKNSLQKKRVKVHIIRLKAYKLTRIYRSKQTFFDFFLKTGVTFPIFSSLIYETRLVAVAERHTRSECGLYLLDTIYMYQIYRGHPSWCPSLRFCHPIYPFPFDFWIKNLQVKKVNPYAAISLLECDGWCVNESQWEYGVVTIRVRRRGSGV